MCHTGGCILYTNFKRTAFSTVCKMLPCMFHRRVV
uniref:Uncharacterized protein n=1 Tax=Anguilla anguilla TaxID=7936 RepID=A0A0E9T4R8_ANGAN